MGHSLGVFTILFQRCNNAAETVRLCPMSTSIFKVTNIVSMFNVPLVSVTRMHEKRTNFIPTV